MKTETFDYVIIGSGFGGSVSALRLTQKGYSVGVIESGKRYKPEDFPQTNMNIRKFLYFPNVFCYGIQRINLLSDVMILSGAGVGGGSLVYANTLYVPPSKVLDHGIMKDIGGSKGLLPFYEVAKKMLGVTQNPKLWKTDEFVKKTAEDMGSANTFTETPVAINFNTDGADPYFGGEGPNRSSCNFCGGCMVGCRYNAKNTLDKNYLYFAEKNGAEVFPETKVVSIEALGNDGDGGYRLNCESTTGFFGKPESVFYATKGLIVSAGVLGTVSLLMKMKEDGRLPHLSAKLGHVVRTNSESLIGVTSLEKGVDYSEGIAITSSVFLDEHTHVEPVRYSKGSDVMGGLAAGVLVDGGGKIPRQLRFLWEVLKNPIRSTKAMMPIGFAKRSVILLVMQTVDNYIQLVRKRRWIWPFKRTLTSKSEKGSHLPSYIPIANEFARRLADKMGGIARSSVNEVLLDIPATAHILGGCIIGDTPETGVLDSQNRVFGYKNMYICDGSMIGANLGVNPSLTITALTERAMSFIPSKEPNGMLFFNFEKKWKVTDVLYPNGRQKPKPKTKSVAKKKVSSKKLSGKKR